MPSTRASTNANPTLPATVCGVLNQNEAVAILETAVKVVPIKQPTHIGCNYSPSDTAQLMSHGEVIVAAFSNASVGSWKMTVASYTHQTRVQPVGNLGDAAVSGQFTSAGATTTYVAVLAGSLAVVVERVTFAGSPVSVGNVVNLARTVLSRL